MYSLQIVQLYTMCCQHNYWLLDQCRYTSRRSSTTWKFDEDWFSTFWDYEARKSAIKKIKVMSVKYIAYWAGMPGGLNEQKF